MFCKTNSVTPDKVKTICSTPIPKEKVKKKLNFLCLCTNLYRKLNKKTSLTCCINNLCGTPLFNLLLLLFFLITLITLIMYLSIFIAKLQTLNQSYFAECTSNSDCNSSIGLHCSTVNECTCPAFNTKNRCNCIPGNFWNGILCTPLLGWNQTGCIADYQCDSSKNLYCTNSSCQCKPPKVWVSSINSCDFNYRGCYYDLSGTLYFTVPYYYGRIYFVEACIDYCYNLKSKFVLMALGYSNDMQCLCSPSISSFGSSTCDITCPGSSNYRCGMTGNTYYRSVYSLA